MSGPEHYREAERLLRESSTPNGTLCEDEMSRAYREAAQVHATLALAAANALPAVEAYIGSERGLWDEQREWTNATAPVRQQVSS